MILEETGKPHGRYMGREFQSLLSKGVLPLVSTAFGPVPCDLDEIYPMAQSLFPSIKDQGTLTSMEVGEKTFLDAHGLEPVTVDTEDGEFDINMLRAVSVARYQFGREAADLLFDGPVELVVSRNTGKIRNVMVSGEHILSMRASDGFYTLRIEGARKLIAGLPYPAMRVTVVDDAIPFNREGRNVFCNFVADCDPELRPMDEAMVVSKDDELLAVGRALLVRDEMLAFKKGVAVKVRDGTSSQKA